MCQDLVATKSGIEDLLSIAEHRLHMLIHWAGRVRVSLDRGIYVEWVRVSLDRGIYFEWVRVSLDREMCMGWMRLDGGLYIGWGRIILDRGVYVEWTSGIHGIRNVPLRYKVLHQINWKLPD